LHQWRQYFNQDGAWDSPHPGSFPLKTLHLLRHAKADSCIGARDHDRPLAKCGIEAADVMAAHMLATGFKVDQVFSSSSRRTRETYDHIKPVLGTTPVVFREDMYLLDESGLLDAIHALPAGARSALFIGHDPGFHMIAAALADPAVPSNDLSVLYSKFPTGALCSLGFAVSSWADILPGTGELLAFVRPKDFD
jgi:phosphohistidine phosphatase